ARRWFLQPHCVHRSVSLRLGMATNEPLVPSMIFRSRMTKASSSVTEQKAWSRSLLSSMSFTRTSVMTTVVLLFLWQDFRSGRKGVRTHREDQPLSQSRTLIPEGRPILVAKAEIAPCNSSPRTRWHPLPTRGLTPGRGAALRRDHGTGRTGCCPSRSSAGPRAAGFPGAAASGRHPDTSFPPAPAGDCATGGPAFPHHREPGRRGGPSRPPACPAPTPACTPPPWPARPSDKPGPDRAACPE